MTTATEIKVPRAVIDAERAALGSTLIDNAAARKALDMLQAEDFYRDDHRIIFNAIREVYQRDKSIDVVTLSEFLKDNDTLGRLSQDDLTTGGGKYLFDLIHTVSSANHVEHYALLVK